MTRSDLHWELVIVGLLKTRIPENSIKIVQTLFSPKKCGSSRAEGLTLPSRSGAHVPGIPAEGAGAHPVQQVPREEQCAGSVLAKEKRRST